MISRAIRRFFGASNDDWNGEGVVSLNAARIPDRVRAYIVGDIHGRADLLADLLGLISSDAQTATQHEKLLIFLGDYVDRGPNSKKVIDMILSARFPGFETIALMGNHEESMLAFLNDPIGAAEWLKYGGAETLLSYGVSMAPGAPKAVSLKAASRDLNDALGEKHRQFLETLSDTHTLGDFMFVHAGVDPKRPLAMQRPQELRWIREAFTSHSGLYEKVVVHGHTICANPELRENRVCIDTGAYYSGKLTCLVLDGAHKRFIQTNP
jgi:serine/threonine protein phosphatase 1